MIMSLLEPMTLKLNRLIIVKDLVNIRKGQEGYLLTINKALHGKTRDDEDYYNYFDLGVHFSENELNKTLNTYSIPVIQKQTLANTINHIKNLSDTRKFNRFLINYEDSDSFKLYDLAPEIVGITNHAYFLTELRSMKRITGNEQIDELRAKIKELGLI